MQNFSQTLTRSKSDPEDEWSETLVSQDLVFVDEQGLRMTATKKGASGDVEVNIPGYKGDTDGSDDYDQSVTDFLALVETFFNAAPGS
jgi:hypothetical protein